MHRAFLAMLLMSSAVACGNGSASPAASTSPAPEATTKFAGTWTYQPGSSILADCAGAALQTIDLSRVPPANHPGFFVLSPADAGAELLEVDARGCRYDWQVTGSVATAVSGQSCATFPDGHGGNRLVHMQSGTKSTTDGASMSVDVRFTTDAPSSCAIHVQGIATKS
jgi:hypothetical protein